MNRSDPPMRALAAAALLLVATLAVPSSLAAINGDHDFAVDIPFPDDLGAGYSGNITILSGSMGASLGHTVDPLLFYNTTEGTIRGLTKVCWNSPSPECRESPAGGIVVSWEGGSSIGLKFPKSASGQASATHALVFFLNPKQTVGFGGVSVTFGKMMGASMLGGEFAFDPLARIPDTAIQDLSANNAAGFVALDDHTVFRVTGGGATATFRAIHDSVTFQGTPVIAPFSPQGIVVPFASGTLSMGHADTATARLGIEGGNLDDLQSRIKATTGGAGGGFDTSAIRATLRQYFQGLEGYMMNGALLHMPVPTEGSDPAAVVRSITLIRFDSLEATGGSTVATTGSGPLHIEGGRVQNAPELIGFAVFQLPWWSYVLWVLAIAAFVTRLVLGNEKAPKQNERWDHLKWIGWIVGPIAFLIFLLLWDNEVKTVLGVSALSGASGAALAMVLLIEFAPMGIVFFAVVTPLRILIKNGLRISKQGSFMGLAGPTATLLGFLFGATLLLSYFDLVLRQFG